MTPNHHPNEAVLADYVSGALRPAFAVAVATHLEACPHCRAQARAMEALGGELVTDLAPSPLADDALARVMAGIERPLDSAAATPVRPAMERIPFGREMWIAPGMSIRKAKMSGSDLLYRLRLPGGLTTITHGHGGVEFTVVLKGAFDDGQSVLSVGDFAEMTEEIDHTPTVIPGSECICLIASEQPMRVKTTLGRLVHLLTGV